MTDRSQLARPVITQTLIKGVLRLLEQYDYFGLTELTLNNGRRADITALGPKGDILIIEVKSSLADYRTDEKWRDYLGFCDQYYFAVSPGFPQTELPESTGLIVADGFGGAFVRPADIHPVAASRRKAMTLKMARLASRRLAGLDIPDITA